MSKVFPLRFQGCTNDGGWGAFQFKDCVLWLKGPTNILIKDSTKQHVEQWIKDNYA